MNVSENCHFSEPTYPVHCLRYVIHECPVGKESGLFCSLGSKSFSNRIIFFVGLQFHDSFFLSINLKTWKINLTELFSRSRYNFRTSVISRDSFLIYHSFKDKNIGLWIDEHITVLIRFQKNLTPFCSHNLAFSFRYCLELRNRIRAKSHSYF